MNDFDEIVIQGTYLYDNAVVCDVRIVKKTFQPELNDMDYDEDQVWEHGVYYRIDFGSATRRGVYSSHSCWIESLSQATAEIEATCPGLKWIE